MLEGFVIPIVMCLCLAQKQKGVADAMIEAVFYAPVNVCDRRECSASVAVGLISASIHGHFRLIPHESASYSTDYKHTYPGVVRSKGMSARVVLR
jgi:hypothetical protein